MCKWFNVWWDFDMWFTPALCLALESGPSIDSKKRPHLVLAIGPIGVAVGPHADQFC